MLPSGKRSPICGAIFDAPKLRAQLAEVEKKVADPNLWSDPQQSQTVMRERKRLEDLLATETDLERRGGGGSADLLLGGGGGGGSPDPKSALPFLRARTPRGR